MLGYRRLGQSDLIDDVAADAGLLLKKQPDDVDASGVAKRLGDGCDILLAGSALGRASL